MVERFVKTTGTISIANGAQVVTGIGTTFSGHDLEGAQIWAIPAAAAPFKVGTIAAVDPRGVYDNLSLPLVNIYRGTSLVSSAYELVDGPAIANGTTQAAIYARFTAHLEQNMGLVGNLADTIDYSLVPENSLFIDAIERIIYQWREGVLTVVNVVAQPFLPRGLYSAATAYALDDLVISAEGRAFISNHAANLANTPPATATSNTHWTWLPLTTPRYEFLVWDNMRPQPAEVVSRAIIATNVVFPVGLAGSYAKSGVAATASSVFSIQKNGVQFATVTFAIAATTGTFASASGATFAPGDELTIVAPNPQDLTLSSVRMTILGNRT